MEIPRALLDEHTAQLNALSEASQRLVLNALENAEWETVAQLRNIMAVVMDQVCFDAVDASRIIAADMYNDVRQVAIGKRLGGYLPGMNYDPAAIEGSVRACIESVVKTGNTKVFGQKLADRVDFEIKNSAADCAMALASRDPMKPRWARVPTGHETCTMCIMLASRGFVYRSEKSATYKKSGGHFHQNCDCRVVQGYKGMTVEGYDPDALYRVWRRLEDAETIAKDLYKGGPVSVTKEAERLDKEASKQWRLFRQSDLSADAYQDTYGSFIWDLSSKAPITVEDFTKAEGKEIQLATWLSDIGASVKLRNPNKALQDGKPTSDFLLDGVRYEAKRIASSNPKKIGTRVNEKLDRQGPRFIVDLSTSDMSRQDAEAKIAWLLEDARIEEILLVKSKTLKRFTK